MEVEIECLYCGHKWTKTVFNKAFLDTEKCPDCRDTNLKIRDIATAKIDAYKGCPPFPQKETYHKGYPWDM